MCNSTILQKMCRLHAWCNQITSGHSDHAYIYLIFTSSYWQTRLWACWNILNFIAVAQRTEGILSQCWICPFSCDVIYLAKHPVTLSHNTVLMHFFFTIWGCIYWNLLHHVKLSHIGLLNLTSTYHLECVYSSGCHSSTYLQSCNRLNGNPFQSCYEACIPMLWGVKYRWNTWKETYYSMIHFPHSPNMVPIHDNLNWKIVVFMSSSLC